VEDERLPQAIFTTAGGFLCFYLIVIDAEMGRLTVMSEKAKRLLNRMVTNDIQNLGPAGTLKLAESLVNKDLSHLGQNEDLIAEELYEELKAQEKLAPLLQKAIMAKEEEVPLALSLNDLL
jgi:hypothetical protein